MEREGSEKDPFEGFEWPKPDPEKYPDQECECGGVAKNTGFPGEYWCDDCGTGFWEGS